MAESVALATPAPRFELGYRRGLDGVRSIAILSVMAFHAGYTRSYGGYLGVDVFFVLSGFLITSLLVADHDRRGGISLARFYSRRARRLLPAMLLMLTAVAIYAQFDPGTIETRGVNRDVIATILYVANWMAVTTYGFTHNMLSHTWSLSIEEQFYMVWPLVLLLLLRSRVPRWAVVAIAGGGYLVSCLERTVQMSHVPVVSPRIFFGTDTRGGTLLIGCFLALVFSWDMVPRAARLFAVPAIVGGVGYLVFAFVSFRYAAAPNGAFSEGITLVGLATALIVFGVVAAPDSLPSRVLSLGPLVWIGKVSYGLYLWHLPVDRLVREGQHTFGLNHWQIQTVRLLITFAIVTVSYYVLEQPIRHGWRPGFAWARAAGDWFNRNVALGRALVLGAAALVLTTLITGLVHTTRNAREASAGTPPVAIRRTVTITPTRVAPGGTATATGQGCRSGKIGFAVVPAPAGAPLFYGSGVVDAGGGWQAVVAVPATVAPGPYLVRVTCRTGTASFEYVARDLRVG
ncbi:MAG TPA: acyltransferase [Acidimicrobiales bacterium]|nr:acyltransferase [Acidimicrobiales bacterium]